MADDRDMRKQLKRVRRLGCRIRIVKRQGEVEVSHPEFPVRRLRLKRTRKDAARALTVLLRRVEERSKT